MLNDKVKYCCTACSHVEDLFAFVWLGILFLQRPIFRLSVAELKQLVSRPDVVEMHDVTARDPRLLVHLKSTRQATPPLIPTPSPTSGRGPGVS